MTHNFDPLIIDFLKESNAIEGVYDDDSLQQAIYAFEYLMEADFLTTGVVLKTHKILMLHQKLLPNEKGYWRRIQVSVGGREGKPWGDVPNLMTHWCNRANDTLHTYDVIIGLDEDEAYETVKSDHVEFEIIHPFVDGNGRVGRMLMNWQLMKIGLEPIVIPAFDRHKYYEWFK